MLKTSEISVDRYPKIRLRAVYDVYKNENLLKLKQLLKEERMKASENPFYKPVNIYKEGSNLK